MNRVTAFVEKMAQEIARKSTRFGQSVLLDVSLLDRSDSIQLSKPGLVSANGSCRLIKAKDGWLAANLPREDDLAAVPALLGQEPGDDAWTMLQSGARAQTCATFLERAELLGLAVSAIGETPAPRLPCKTEVNPAPKARRHTLRVLDFSALWAGPLCGSIFAAMGADVIKLESVERPDTTAQSAPLHDQRLNGEKLRKRVALKTSDGIATLHNEISYADILITSARARALESLGVTQASVFAAKPSLIWIAITGHGFDSARIAFGDDAAASGGLVAWEGDEPRFVGDALADPLTGLAAADAALDALDHGGGAFIDAALARTAAYVAGLQA